MPIYYPDTNQIEYVDGVVMPLPLTDVFWIDDSRIKAMDEYGVDQAMLEISPGLEVIDDEIDMLYHGNAERLTHMQE